MADTKISALPASTTPLAGTEVLPIVQGGATKQVSVANLTAARAISATQLTLTTGSLIVANGQGINFSATPGTGTSKLLNDYEEGTWTPRYSTSTPPTTPFTMNVLSATYTKVGRMVNVRAVIRTNNVNTAGCAGVLVIQGLPFASAAVSDGQTPILVARVEAWGGDFPDGGYVEGGKTEINLQFRTAVNGATSFMNAADLTTGAVANQNFMHISATYYV
jgi:hypothetical protein